MQLGSSSCGLKLGPSHAAFVDVSRTWWGRSRRRQRQVDLPPGLIRPSPVEPNIADVGALETQIRRLLENKRTKSLGRRPMVLVLPDLCVRATLVALDVIPARASELETLLRWRLEREAFLPMTGTRLTWQVLDPRTVLTVAVRETVIKQYEAVCEAVGLFPVEVDTATFRLCNLFSNLVPAAEPVAWLSLLDDGFTLIIFRAGRPALVRTKARTYSDPEGLFQDIANSLTLHGEGHTQSAPRRLILLAEEPGSELVQRISSELGLEVIQPGWDEVKHAGWSPSDSPHQVSILAAVAGLLGAA